MTVINKLSQTLEMLKSCEANCQTFSMDTNDQNAKDMYKQMAQTIKQAQDMLQSRINFVTSQEPQYLEELQPKQNMTSMQTQQSSQPAQNVQPPKTENIPSLE